MSKSIYIDNYCGNYYAALADESGLLEYHVDAENSRKIVGNIYKGRVENVLNGMQAAFVNIGLAKNGYLYVGDMLVDKAELDGRVDIPVKLNMNAGDEIMVQAVKDPAGSKGARLTSIISFAGRYIVYLPFFDFTGISRKITNEPLREKLTAFANRLKGAGEGIIMRTASESANKKDIKKEYEYLRYLFERTKERYDKAKVSEMVYEEGDLPSKMLRDVFTPDVENIYIKSQPVYERLKEENRYAFVTKPNFILYRENIDMFKYFKLDTEVAKIIQPKVELQSGAYLVFDKTEALTVIDVNTGRFTGDNDLAQTVLDTNILAAREIARQVRLRNISGIIVVDFIDMESEEHKQRVIAELEEALKADRIKCNVSGMSALGLVEFTRKKTHRDVSSYLQKSCPYCNGDGKIYSYDYIITKLRVSLLDLFADGYINAVIDLNADVAKFILTSGALSKDIEKIWQNKRIYLVPHRTFHEHFFKTKGDNSKVLDIPDTAKLLY